MEKINISFQIDLKNHSDIKKVAKSQEMSLQAYFMELHNKHIQGKQLFDRDELLRKIHSNGKMTYLLQLLLVVLVVVTG